jgi:ring-1,2-phenylacetyl-CoA epoxidase subunit PaaE
VAPAARRVPHALRVEEIRPLTDDAVAITLGVPDELGEAFRFTAGQHITIVAPSDGGERRRSYSIFTAPGDLLRVAVRRVEAGWFSGYVHDQLRAGDTFQVIPPTGSFTVVPDPGVRKRYCMLAAGSGITPILSIVSAVLAGEPRSTCSLVMGNRSVDSIMLREEVNDLKDRYPTRLDVLHVLSRESGACDVAEGRIDAEKLSLLLDRASAAPVDEWYVCGPFPMVQDVQAALAARDVPPSQVHIELFSAGAPTPSAGPVAAATPDTQVTVVLDGRRSTVAYPVGSPSLLDAVRRARPEVPYSCEAGVCGTCRCRLVEGEVRMNHAYALDHDEQERGIVLACQSVPLTPSIVLDFDDL